MVCAFKYGRGEEPTLIRAVVSAIAAMVQGTDQPGIRPYVPSRLMATSRLGNELRRWADLTVIQRAKEARLPDVIFWEMCLKDVAELCRCHYAARAGRDCNEVRDQLLGIAIEWDLSRDRLDRQSETCFRTIAEFLR